VGKIINFPTAYPTKQKTPPADRPPRARALVAAALPPSLHRRLPPVV